MVAEAALSPWERVRPRSTPGGIAGGRGRRCFGFEPLLEVLGRHLPPAVFAAKLGVRERQLFRWIEYGLTERQADELALRVGYHPCEVWPDW